MEPDSEATNSSQNAHEPAKAIPVEEFERENIKDTITVPALKIKPQHISAAMKRLKNYLLNRSRHPNVVEVQNAEAGTTEKVLLLAKGGKEQEGGKRKAEKNEEVRSAATEHTPANNNESAADGFEVPDAVREFIAEHEAVLVNHTITFTYTNFTFEEVLKRLLPEGVEVPGSFETIGHVVHLNLRPPQEPYRLLIAHVLVDKYPQLKTVVNKVGVITNEFRVFQMEILADKHTHGEVPRVAAPSDPALLTSLRQTNCTFHLNFGEVYWNSRLEGEHKRLVSSFKPQDEIWDMFAGIGPFAVPAAKMHRCRVFANDLNPQSVHFLDINVAANKVQREVTTHNLCARAFLRGRVADCGSQVPAPDGKIHCVMNLPASAPEFMDCFRGAFSKDVWPHDRLPTVHLYAFSKNSNPKACEDDIRQRAEASLGFPIAGVASHCVRDVAPKKLMLCLSFQLPPDAAYDSAREPGSQGEEEPSEGEVDGQRERKRARSDAGGG